MALHIGIGHLNELLPLGNGYRLLWAAEIQTSPSAHLDKDQLLPVLGYDVDFTFMAAEVSLDGSVAQFLDVLPGYPLP